MEFDSTEVDAGRNVWRPMWQLNWMLHGLLMFPSLLIAWELSNPPGNFGFVVVAWLLVVLGVPLLPRRSPVEPFTMS